MTSVSSSREATSRSLNHVSAALLREWAPFIRKDLIRAADVVLSRGKGWESAIIAGATRGRYSHAAIFLPFRQKDEILPRKIDIPKGTERVDFEGAIRKYGGIPVKGGVHLDLVEADDYGVGAVPPRYLSVVFGGHRYEVIRLTGHSPPKAAVVLRHPDIKCVDESVIEDETRTFSDDELLRRYSSINRLAKPLALPEPIKRSVAWMLRRLYPDQERLILPGCFCSELVAKFYERLGIPLFVKPIAAENISPNDLLPPSSLFEPVPGAVITANDIPDDARGEVIGVLQIDLRAGEPASKNSRKPHRRSYLMSLVETREQKELHFPELKRRIDDIAAATKAHEQVISAIESNRDLVFDAGGATIQGQILDIVSDESLPATLRSRLDDLLVMTIFLKLLRDRLRRENLPLEAALTLRLIHDRMIAELFYRHERSQTLVRMSRARRRPANLGRQERESALADWRSKKDIWMREIAAMNRPIRRRTIPNGPSEEETQALVDKVLGEVTNETLTTLHLR